MRALRAAQAFVAHAGLQDVDRAGITVDPHAHPRLELARPLHASGDDGQAVLPAEDGRVAEDTAHIGDHGRSDIEQRRPHRGGLDGHEDVSRLELVEVLFRT